ncbi:hypothetical protein BLOT_012214 [Blomia tropicalis]|nr:hypothetical protein BLOT_012214 [Blomia tropicalis]
MRFGVINERTTKLAHETTIYRKSIQLDSMIAHLQLYEIMVSINKWLCGSQMLFRIGIQFII